MQKHDLSYFKRKKNKERNQNCNFLKDLKNILTQLIIFSNVTFDAFQSIIL